MDTEEKIDEILATVTRMEPMVKEHHTTLYGNGQPGLSKKMVLLEERQDSCPARKASTEESRAVKKRLSIGVIAIVIATLSCLSSVAMGLISLLRV